MNKSENNEIMTVEEVAKLVRVSERTVYDWAKKGEIPCGKLGAIWRFRRSSIVRWIEDHLGTERSDYFTPPVSIAGTLTPRRVVFTEKSDKNGVLEELIINLAQADEVTNPDELRQGIFHREDLMSTGIGYGIGVPHAKLTSVVNIVMSVGVCRNPLVDYGSIDSEPVTLIFMIASNVKQHSQQIKLMAHVLGKVKRREFADRLRHAFDGEEVHALLMGGDTFSAS